MPPLPDTPISILAGPLPPLTAVKILLAIIGLILIVVSVRRASPARLTGILSEAMDRLTKVYEDVAATGFLGIPPQDVLDIVSVMHTLRVQVGRLRAERLHNSRTWGTTLGEFFRGRSITLYHCIEDVEDFETRLTIFKEEQRNAAFSLASAVSQSTGTAPLRR
ncbi:hypothetical protein C8R46DRAFT_1211123 [Mycena filopes]|nr:hypothetical protein C8R46DRAFT_1211123 [Mycena filopes]